MKWNWSSSIDRVTIVLIIIVLFVLAVLLGRFFAKDAGVHYTDTKGIFYLYLDDGKMSVPVKHLYSFSLSPDGDKNKSIQWGTVGSSTKVELVGKKIITEFDSCLVRLEGKYIELPGNEGSIKPRLYKYLKITLVFD